MGHSKTLATAALAVYLTLCWQGGDDVTVRTGVHLAKGANVTEDVVVNRENGIIDHVWVDAVDLTTGSALKIDMGTVNSCTYELVGGLTPDKALRYQASRVHYRVNWFPWQRTVGGPPLPDPLAWVQTLDESQFSRIGDFHQDQIPCA